MAELAHPFAQPYEAPISLDASRMIGTRHRRPTLWTVAAILAVIPIAVCVWQQFPVLAFVAVVWLLVCYTFGTSWGLRSAEYWLGVWYRDRRLPRRMDDKAVGVHHAPFSVREHAVVDHATETPRGVVEIDGTTNLRMTDDDTLGATIKRLSMFFNGLRFPIQVVVRATEHDNLIERRWFIATAADDERVLGENLQGIVTALNRAGLRSHALNGDLFDALQHCWGASAQRLGPSVVHRHRSHVQSGDEYVRGFLLVKLPRTTEPNWLAPLLDGDLPIDFSAWLDPSDSANEQQYLADRVNEWETAQVLNVNRSGYRDPDLDDCINDAKRTRLLLRRRELRVVRATLGFVVRAPSLAEVAERERHLLVHLREQVGDDALVPLDWEHDRALKMPVPLGEPAIEYPLRVVTPALARAYPFSNSSLTHPGGVDVGTSTGSHRLNRLDVFSLTNPHMVVLGISGSGKGFWIKVYLWRLLHAYRWQDRVRIFIIQSEKDEYSALADAMERDYIGPLYGESPRAEIKRLVTLEDVERLTHRGFLESYQDLTVFDLTRIGIGERWEVRQVMKGKAIALLLGMIDDAMARHERHRRRGVCVIDELGIVLNSDEAAAAIDIAYRRFRSIPWDDDPTQVNRIAMIGASQRPSDLLKHPRGKVLVDQSMTRVYFRQNDTDLRSANRELKLSGEEEAFLTSAEEGTGLLVADLARVGFHLHATPEEERFAKT